MSVCVCVWNRVHEKCYCYERFTVDEKQPKLNTFIIKTLINSHKISITACTHHTTPVLLVAYIHVHTHTYMYCTCAVFAYYCTRMMSTLLPPTDHTCRSTSYQSIKSINTYTTEEWYQLKHKHVQSCVYHKSSRKHSLIPIPRIPGLGPFPNQVHSTARFIHGFSMLHAEEVTCTV